MDMEMDFANYPWCEDVMLAARQKLKLLLKVDKCVGLWYELISLHLNL